MKGHIAVCIGALSVVSCSSSESLLAKAEPAAVERILSCRATSGRIVQELIAIDPSSQAISVVFRDSSLTIPRDVSPDGRIILIESDRDVSRRDGTSNGDTHLFAYRLLDSTMTRLSSTSAASVVDRGGDYNTDGSRILFAHDSLSTGLRVMSMKADGTDRKLLSAPSSFGGVWSPDGSTIAYTQTVSGQQRIMIATADGVGATRLTTSSIAPELAPAFSPDGQSVAFYSVSISPSGGSTSRLYVWSRTSSTLRTLDQSTDATSPAWSPDGNRIAATTASGIRIFDAATGAVVATLGGTPVAGTGFCAPVWKSVRIAN